MQKSPRIVLYVKHYLSPEGLLFFEKTWFPKVLTIISQQEGFLLLKHMGTDRDCVFLTLEFQDEQTLNKWADYAGHDELVNALDPYRSRDYWEVQIKGEPWEKIASKRTTEKN